jgi:protein KRI1
MTAKTLLFDDLPKEKDDIHTLKLNDKYLASFNARKRKEALAKEAARFRNENSASESSSTSEEEDSDAELLTKEVQAKILTTLSKIKSKDATIYDKEKKFFNEEDFQEKDTKKKTVKPLTFSRFMSKTLVKVYFFFIFLLLH